MFSKVSKVSYNRCDTDFIKYFHLDMYFCIIYNTEEFRGLIMLFKTLGLRLYMEKEKNGNRLTAWFATDQLISRKYYFDCKIVELI